jgi:glyoxylase-like metal-dependent hydrolase (beta-lactamase superfamily II)
MRDRVERREKSRERAGRGGIRVGVAFAAFLLQVLPAAAQQDFSKVAIETTSLGSGLAMMVGAGGNLGVSFGPDGVFLVDDQYAPMSPKIRAAVRDLSPQPIRFVLNTHWHGDHTGGNENLGRGGTLILAHHAVRTRMSTEQLMAAVGRPTPPSPKEALPVVTFEEGVTLHLNGQTIEAIHVAPAHTDGDSLVYFREADVLHMGDTFFAGMYPFFDASSGGRIDGMIDAVTRGLEIAGPKTRIIPGHGPLSSRSELEATREMLVEVRDRVRLLVQQGMDRETAIAARPTRAFDERHGGGFMTPDRFVGLVYDGLLAEMTP